VSKGHGCPKFKQKSTIIFWQSKGDNSRMEKMLKSEIECDLPYMVNPETLATFGLQRQRTNKIEDKQDRGQTRQRTKTIKRQKHNTENKKD
jgi:hypothetical protein